MHTKIDARAAALGLALALVLPLPATAQGALPPPSLGFTRDFSTQTPQTSVYSLALFDDGTGEQLYVGGNFTAIIGVTTMWSWCIGRWNGTWSPVGGGFYWTDGTWYPPIWQIAGEPGVYSLCAFDDGSGPKLYAGGNFNLMWAETASGWDWIECGGLVRWDGQRWANPPGLYVGGMAFWTRSMVVFDDGSGSKLYPAGKFYGSIPGVKRWTGQSWELVGGPTDLQNSTGNVRLFHYTVYDDGSGPKLYAFGDFTTVEGQPADGVATWDGTRWTPIHVPPHPQGGLLSAQHVVSSAVFDDGSGPALYFGAYFLYRYRAGAVELVPINGQYLNAGSETQFVHVYDDGNGPALYVGANALPWSTPQGIQYTDFARWDGQTWTPLGAPQPAAGGACYSGLVWDRGDGPDLYLAGRLGNPILGGQFAPFMARYRGVHRDLSLVCGGDGSLTVCPCATPPSPYYQPGAVGHGCPNSANPDGAQLVPQSNGSLDALQLRATSLPPSAACILVQGSAYDYRSRKLGDGVLCTAGTQLRLFTDSAVGGTVTFAESGEGTLRERAALQGDLLPPGAVRYYQAWYRDPDPAFCADGGLFNVTNGVRVVW